MPVGKLTPVVVANVFLCGWYRFAQGINKTNIVAKQTIFSIYLKGLLLFAE